MEASVKWFSIILHLGSTDLGHNTISFHLLLSLRFLHAPLFPSHLSIITSQTHIIYKILYIAIVLMGKRFLPEQTCQLQWSEPAYF